MRTKPSRFAMVCAIAMVLFASRVVSGATSGRVLVDERFGKEEEEEDTKKFLYRRGEEKEGEVNFFDAPFGDVSAKDVPEADVGGMSNNGFAPRRALQVRARKESAFR
jgi:hypothetical protein